MYYIESSDGVNLAVYDLNPEGDKTIVMVHGWPLSHKMFEYQIPILLKNNYRVITMDIRGFGNSQETKAGYDYHQLATDLYYIMNALNLNDVCLVGFSMGGAIAVKYMGLYKGHRVSKLCLWDAAVPSYSKTDTNPYGARIEDTNNLIQMGYNDRPNLNKYFGTIFFAKMHSEPFMNWMQNIADGSSGLGEMKCLISLRDENVWEELKEIDVPTGIFHGKEDKICPFSMANIINENIKNSKLYAFDDGGHGAFYDVKDEFNEKLIEFLKSQ